MKKKFIKRIRNKQYNISISINSEIKKNKNNIFFFGNPIHKNLENISSVKNGVDKKVPLVTYQLYYRIFHCNF